MCFVIIERILLILIPAIIALLAGIGIIISCKHHKGQIEKTDEIISLSKSANELSKKIAYEANRPKLTLGSLTINLNNIKVYKGEHVELVGTDPIQPYLDIVSEPINLKRVSYLPIGEKKYLFINLLPSADEEHKQNAVLFLDVLNLKLNCYSDEISLIEVEESFSVKDNANICENMDLKIEIHRPKKLIELPIAYAFRSDSRQLPIKFSNILTLKNSGSKEEFNLLEPKNEKERKDIATKYILFDETAYLFKCTTIAEKDNVYYYSSELSLDT